MSSGWIYSLLTDEGGAGMLKVQRRRLQMMKATTVDMVEGCLQNLHACSILYSNVLGVLKQTSKQTKAPNK